MPKEYPVPFAYSKIGAWASFPDIQGAEMVDLTTIQLSYSENDIPTATCGLSIGTDPRTGKIALSHKQANELERRQRVSLYIQLSGDEVPGVPWPKGAFKIFEGYVSGVGSHRAGSSTSLTVAMDHWLSDMLASSKMSAYLHPMSSGSLLQRITPEGVLMSQSTKFGSRDVFSEDVVLDVWNNGIKPMFQELSESDRMDVDALSEILQDPAALSNDRALDAINKFDKNIDVQTLSIRGLEGNNSLQSVLADWLNYHFFSIVGGPGSGSTLWDVLQQLASTLQFSIIPNATGATCAPHVRQISKTYAYVKASEYMEMHITGKTPLVLRGLGLSNQYNNALYDTDDRAKPHVNVPAALPFLSEGEVQVKTAIWFAGFFDLVAMNKAKVEANLAYYKPLVDGQFIIGKPPAWLDAAIDEDNTTNTLPVGKQARVSVMNPTPVQAGGGQQRKGSNEKYYIVGSSRIGDRFAQAVFLNMAFHSRTGMMPGRLRFDIAPGSSIVIQNIGEKIPFYRGEKVYANVAEVMCNIDALNSQAGTGFRLTNMRTDAEQNELEGLAVEEHPLYNNTWIGTYLVPGFTPPNREE